VGKVGGCHSDGRANMCPQVLKVLSRTRGNGHESKGGCENNVRIQHLCSSLEMGSDARAAAGLHLAQVS
jgi:hypothetical protein